jgi:heat shock protein HtpX
MARRRELFPPDRGLQVRMAAALVAWIAVVVGAVVGAVLVFAAGSDGPDAIAFAVVAVGVVVALGMYRRAEQPDAAPPPLRELERAEGAVERVSMVADLSPPAVRVLPVPAPISWTTGVPGLSHREIWLTSGLLARVNNSELEAVVGHELSHVAHGDAALMSVIAGPPTALLRGLVRLWDFPDWGWRFAAILMLYGATVAPIALVMAFIGRVVSRHREFAADRGAAMLTGSPAALMSALVRISEDLADIPDEDLRAVAPRDPFHLLPVKARKGGVLGFFVGTHPPLSRRLEQLERMERSLQHAR